MVQSRDCRIVSTFRLAATLARRSLKARVLLALAALAFLYGCGGDDPTTPDKDELDAASPADAWRGSWSVSTVNNVPFTSTLKDDLEGPGDTVAVDETWSFYTDTWYLNIEVTLKTLGGLEMPADSRLFFKWSGAYDVQESTFTLVTKEFRTDISQGLVELGLSKEAFSSLRLFEDTATGTWSAEGKRLQLDFDIGETWILARQ